MKRGSITKFKLDPRKPPRSDWRAFDAMSEAARHRAALSDPDAQPATKAQLARARRVPSVRALRTKTRWRARLRVRRAGSRAAWTRPIAELCAGGVDLSRALRAAVEDFLAHRMTPPEEEKPPRSRGQGRRRTREQHHRWMMERE